MVNLLFYYYEDKLIRKAEKKDLITALKFHNVFRFIDNLTALNGAEEFEKVLHETYLPENELKKENISDFEASFLDPNIKIAHKRITLSLYNKRDSFPFSIVRMPYLSSNVLSKRLYASLGVEILTTSDSDNFKS